MSIGVLDGETGFCDKSGAIFGFRALTADSGTFRFRAQADS